MVILEAALLYILYKFFGAVFSSDSFVPRTPAEAQKQAEYMKMAAEYLKQQEANKENEKDSEKNLNEFLDEKNLSEEEKKEVENYTKEGNPEQLEKNANALEKAADIVKDAKTNEKGEIVVDAKLNDKLKKEDDLLPTIVKHEVAKQEKEKAKEIEKKEVENLEDAPVGTKKEETKEETKVETKEVIKEEKVEEKVEVQEEPKPIPEEKVSEKEEKSNDSKVIEQEQQLEDSTYVLETIEDIDTEIKNNLSKSIEPDRVKINEKILVQDIKNEDEMIKYRNSVDEINEMQKDGMRRTEYLNRTGYSSDITTERAVFSSGNKKDIEKYLSDNPNVSQTLKDHLNNRITAINVFEKLEKTTDISQKGIMTPRTGKTKAGNDLIMFDNLKYDSFQNGNECWSYSYSLLLKSRGVNLKPEYVRSFRPGLNIEDAKNINKLDERAWEQMNTDSRNSIFDMADLSGKVLQNTALNNVILRGNAETKGKSKEEQGKIFANGIKNLVRNALEKDKSPLAMTVGYGAAAHTSTVVGMDGDDLIIQDSLSTHHQNKNNDAGEYLRINVYQLGEFLYERGSGQAISFDWFKDLQPDLKGGCKDINSISNGNLECKDGKFEYSSSMTKDDIAVHNIANPLIRSGKTGMWAFEKDGLMEEHKIYVPKEIKAPEKNLGEKNTEKNLNKSLNNPERKNPQIQEPQKNGPGMEM